MTEGLQVRIDHMAIHFDADLWGPISPYEFYPSRHNEKRHPLSFLAFGVGPRICLGIKIKLNSAKIYIIFKRYLKIFKGMKFAMVQMKLALVKVLLEYEVCATESTPKSLEYIEKILRNTKSTIPIVFKKKEISFDLSEDPANMPPDHLSPKIFSPYLAPETSCKDIVKNPHKKTDPLSN